MLDDHRELWDLLNALCESRLTPGDAARLEELVLSSAEARWQYLTYMDLHGTLYWDAAGGLAVADKIFVDRTTAAEPISAETFSTRPFSPPLIKAATRRRYHAAGLAAAVALVLGIVFLIPKSQPVVDSDVAHIPPHVEIVPTEKPSRTVAATPRHPIRLAPLPAIDPKHSEKPSIAADDAHTSPAAELTTDPTLPASVQEPVARINHFVKAGWSAAQVAPSERADDASWLRRVYLDLAGHIPSAEETRRFLADRRDDKRQQLVDRLLDDPAFARHLTTQWANLLVGRVSGSQVNRPALEQFLRTSFASSRGWHEIVTDLVAAEGRSDENGAANFLIAHLNNQAVPATAITARLFLGVQVQCTQCHNHPSGFAKQTDFWEFNSFFHQTEAVLLTERDPITGQVKSQVSELVSQPTGGPTYYETTNGVMKAVYPKYHDQEVSAAAEVNRRQKLAQLMVEVDGDQLAAAFINRTWRHFFGFGFTRSVDDMGPHSPVSHPELLAGLSQSFRASGFDIKQLARWICLSEPYQLSSRFNESNVIDDPERGEMPLFSRIYPQPMTVEQLYDSFLVATKAHQHGVADWTAAESQRQEWLRQFIVAFQTEENDEANTFEGTVTQALALMNGPLINKALETKSGTYLSEVLRSPVGETEKIERLCLAALSRKPSPQELPAMHMLVRRPASSVEGYQDLFWALLNSNEFAVVY